MSTEEDNSKNQTKNTLAVIVDMVAEEKTLTKEGKSTTNTESKVDDTNSTDTPPMENISTLEKKKAITEKMKERLL